MVVGKRQLVAEAIRADPACSDRSIAHDLGVSLGRVARMRQELAAAGETVLDLPVRGRDWLTYQYKSRRVSHVAELDLLYRRLYPVVRVAESEEFCEGWIAQGRRRMRRTASDRGAAAEAARRIGAALNAPLAARTVMGRVAFIQDPEEAPEGNYRHIFFEFEVHVLSASCPFCLCLDYP